MQPNKGYAQLKDPSGAPYSPDQPPVFIQEDPILGPALKSAPAESDALRVTVIFSEQQEASDLGAPEEFERLIEDAQLFGDSTWGLRLPSEDKGYTTRMVEASEQAVLEGRLHIVGLLDDTHAHENTLEYIERLRAYGDGLDAELAADKQQSLDTRIKLNAAMGHTVNALQWLAVANACTELSAAVRRTSMAKQHLVVSLHPLGAGVPLGIGVLRMFRALKIESTVVTPGNEYWSEQSTETEACMDTTLATGRIALQE